MCKTSERSVRLYSRRLVQAEESGKKKKERESSLLLPGLQRCLTFSAWPSKGSVVFDPSLHFSLEFLSPFLLQTPGFWLTLHTLGLLSKKKSQQNYCVSLNPRWKIKKDISSDIEKFIFFFFFFPSRWSLSAQLLQKKDISDILTSSSLVLLDICSSACGREGWEYLHRQDLTFFRNMRWFVVFAQVENFAFRLITPSSPISQILLLLRAGVYTLCEEKSLASVCVDVSPAVFDLVSGEIKCKKKKKHQWNN